MQKTRDRNAVLVFVAPRAHKYAVVGDVGVHEKCGEQFWKKLVNDMRAHFKSEDFNRAIVLAISEVGKLLAAHFPRYRRYDQRAAGRDRARITDLTGECRLSLGIPQYDLRGNAT